MTRKKNDLRKVASLIVLAILIPVTSLADAVDDVGAVVERYLSTENDLAEQGKLMTEDRTFIAAGLRFTDNVVNMQAQVAGEKLREALDPDGVMFVTAEDTMTKVYGDTAVVSFYRHWNWIPGADAVRAGQAGNPPPSQVVTLVLNKQRGDWKIVHTHISPMGAN